MPHPFLFPVYFLVNFLFRVAVTAFRHALVIGFWYLIFKFIFLFVYISIGFTDLFWRALPVVAIVYSIGWLIYLAWRSAIISWDEGFNFNFPNQDTA